jgi:uncharacterized membrane protein
MEQNVTPHVREHHVHQRHFDRLVMLSDGVFAIAMTLSAVELRPEAKPGETLLQVWGLPLLAYFLTFFILGLVWLQHRRSLAQLRRTDNTLTMITLVLLSLVALMPVLIRAMVTAESGLTTGLGLTVYAFALLMVNVCLTVGWAYAAFIGGLVPDMPRSQARGWLLHDVFATLVWAAIGCWLLHLVWLAALMAALALAARIASARLMRRETAAPG